MISALRLRGDGRCAAAATAIRRHADIAAARVSFNVMVDILST
jgi:hypothetical protein